ncbi:Endoribonuclease YSH1 [Nadsonia fulvescens var. elongata DSM 6958]|uniref:Endoribonuclease YSH1 n=1 Tax=Nadsonia fulvescens var. elongata DSM 6958 TaxID=857566 RepID=A0A1E3PCZ1_9ASCO|nr:Endoribonuclease YSH1 [Nadsonia fulvescens var. elongata DSM 6958]
MSVKRVAEYEIADDSDILRFVCLGGGSEVGRSCHIIEYKGKRVMLDAGIHPAYTGAASLPFYDTYDDLGEIDLLLISHFHLDHAASLPYVMTKTEFKGKVFMTHPTKAIYRWLLSDFVRVSSVAENDPSLYNDEDLAKSFDQINTIDYHSTMEVNGIRFTAYHAGHVLGAAMYLIEIDGVKILFTGDYSREEDRHLNVAEVPPTRPDILITESTYGTGIHRNRLEKETRLTSLIHSTISKGGRCLLPVFALGRAQEILLILDEYWDQHSDLEGVNIYYASSLARKCMAVYQTYINMMNDNIRKKFRDSKTNPFQFKHIKNIKNLDRFEDIGPCVMVASPGMLQNGVSRELLERWAPDPKNALILTGYSVEGTMAKQILNEPTEIPSINGQEIKIPRRLSVEELSFAAHVDYQQNAEFIDLVNAPNIILVHGESNNMGRLKSALLSKYHDRKGTENEVKVYNPKNCVTVNLPFKGTKIAKTMGFLAETAPKDGQFISGVLVQKDFQTGLMQLSDLEEYSGLTTTILMERQTIIVEAGPELVRYHLEQMFGNISILEESDDSIKLRIMEAVEVSHIDNRATIEWSGSIMNDTIADATLAILLTVDSSPASVKLSSKSCSHSHGSHDDTNMSSEPALELSRAEKIQNISAVLRAQFGDTLEIHEDGSHATIKIEAMVADIDFNTLEVECKAPSLKQRVAHVLNRAISLASPLLPKLTSDSNPAIKAEIKSEAEPEIKEEVQPDTLKIET